MSNLVWLSKKLFFVSTHHAFEEATPSLSGFLMPTLMGHSNCAANASLATPLSQMSLVGLSYMAWADTSNLVWLSEQLTGMPIEETQQISSFPSNWLLDDDATFKVSRFCPGGGFFIAFCRGSIQLSS